MEENIKTIKRFIFELGIIGDDVNYYSEEYNLIKKIKEDLEKLINLLLDKEDND